MNVFFIILLFILNGGPDPGPKETVRDGSIELRIYDFEGFKPILEQQDDTLYIINFWATWCKPCIRELPLFEEISKQYQDEPVKVILVSLDFRKQVSSRLIPYIRDNNIISEVIMLHEPDANTWIDRIDTSWGGAIPATLIYRNGDRWFYQEEFEGKELKTIVETKL